MNFTDLTHRNDGLPCSQLWDLSNVTTQVFLPLKQNHNVALAHVWSVGWASRRYRQCSRVGWPAMHAPGMLLSCTYVRQSNMHAADHVYAELQTSCTK